MWAGVEARGFIFGPPIALAIGAKFVPIRKPKKLPGIRLLSQIYTFVLLMVFSLQTSKRLRKLYKMYIDVTRAKNLSFFVLV